MAEKRSVPTALGILIGPALAYLSYHILCSGMNEFIQVLVFALFVLAGHDLARGGLSLTGSLVVLFVPAIPVAIYLGTLAVPAGHQLGAQAIVALWVASALLGAVLAGRRSPGPGGAAHLTRLAVLGVGLVLVVAALLWLS